MVTNQQRNVPYLSEKQFELIEQLPEDIKLIMLGCDTEFFQSKFSALSILGRLAKMEKDISVITKLALPEDYIGQLREYDNILRGHGNILGFSVSIPCIESAKIWEPKASSPEKRMATLQMAHAAGLKTMLAIRPLLPSIPDDELKRVVSATAEYSDGYYSGPLYLKELEEDLVPSDLRPNLRIEKVQPHWMPEGNAFYKIEKDGQMDTLRQNMEANGKLLFEGAAEGIAYLKAYEQH